MQKFNLISPLSLVILLCTAHAPVNVLAMEKNTPKDIDLKHALEELDRIADARRKSFFRGDDYDYQASCSYKKQTNNLLLKVQTWLKSKNAEEIDLNIQSKNGNTLLRYVLGSATDTIRTSRINDEETKHFQKMVEFLNYLLENNASPNIPNNTGETPFYDCMRDCLTWYNNSGYDMYEKEVQEKLDALTALLLKYNANPDIAGDLNDVLMMLAIRKYCPKMQEIFDHMTTIKDGINSFGKDGSTPACTAACFLNLDLLRIFHKAGADFNHKSLKNKTPLDYAAIGKADSLAWIDKSDPEYKIAEEKADNVIKFLQEHAQANQ